jgi:DNA-binding HxlR family transcriptional regulator
MTDWDAAQLAVNLVSGKWDIRILAALEHSSKRYNELSRDIGVRHKVLTETLQRLEHVGLISRTVGAGSPPEVRYELMPLARSLIDPLTALAEWGRDNSGALAGEDAGHSGDGTYHRVGRGFWGGSGSASAGIRGTSGLWSWRGPEGARQVPPSGWPRHRWAPGRWPAGPWFRAGRHR